jgi:hypothetical protein
MEADKLEATTGEDKLFSGFQLGSETLLNTPETSTTCKLNENGSVGSDGPDIHSVKLGRPFVGDG